MTVCQPWKKQIPSGQVTRQFTTMNKNIIFDSPVYSWFLLAINKNGKSCTFLYDGVGCKEFNKNALILNKGICKTKYLSGNWWKHNTYHKRNNNIYYIHNHKYNTSIMRVINNEISITDYFKDRKKEFFKNNPQQLNMVFVLIIEKINNQFKMNLQLDEKRKSFESYIHVIDMNTKNKLILTWKNSYT